MKKWSTSSFTIYLIVLRVPVLSKAHIPLQVVAIYVGHEPILTCYAGPNRILLSLLNRTPSDNVVGRTIVTCSYTTRPHNMLYFLGTVFTALSRFGS